MASAVPRSPGSAAYRLFLLTHEMTKAGASASYGAENTLAWHKSVASMPNPYQSSQSSTMQPRNSASKPASSGSSQRLG
jgi:hypothetical protein